LDWISVIGAIVSRHLLILALHMSCR